MTRHAIHTRCVSIIVMLIIGQTQGTHKHEMVKKQLIHGYLAP